MPIGYSINSKNDGKLNGSFFYSSAIHVNVIVDSTLNFYNLKNILGVFYYLQSISLKGQITETTARRIIASVPMSPTAR